jgi:hypothetical protein
MTGITTIGAVELPPALNIALQPLCPRNRERKKKPDYSQR